MNRTLLLISAGLLLALTGCRDGGSGQPAAGSGNQAAEGSQQRQAEQRTQQPAAGAPQPQAPAGAEKATASEKLLDPAGLREQAPATFRVRFETTKGPFVLEVHRDWAPQGADRFYNLVKNGFYDDVAFFRAIENFMVQFGIHGDPKVAAKWRTATIPDDPPKQTNARGTISFATSGPNSRTTQVFINYKDNGFLDQMGFAPFGRVVEGMEVVDSLYKGYGEGSPRGMGPNQGMIQTQGNAYLRNNFPQLDYTTKVTIVEAE